jgi:hypothetical protein
MQSAPPPARFVKEDVNKPENRTNLALFGLMLIPGIRTWLLKRLGLPVDSIMYPPQNVLGGRPDFVVVGPNETVEAWIEVELGGENQAQLAQYRARLDEPVLSISKRSPTPSVVRCSSFWTASRRRMSASSPTS